MKLFFQSLAAPRLETPSLDRVRVAAVSPGLESALERKPGFDVEVVGDDLGSEIRSRRRW
jgi:hypothetical protein